MTNVITPDLDEELFDELYRTISKCGDLTPIRNELVRRMELVRPVTGPDWLAIEEIISQVELIFRLDSDMPHQSQTLRNAGIEYARLKRNILLRMKG